MAAAVQDKVRLQPADIIQPATGHHGTSHWCDREELRRAHQPADPSDPPCDLPEPRLLFIRTVKDHAGAFDNERQELQMSFKAWCSPHLTTPPHPSTSHYVKTQ